MFGIFVCIDRSRFGPPDRHDKILLQAFAPCEPDRMPLGPGCPTPHEKRQPQLTVRFRAIVITPKKQRNLITKVSVSGYNYPILLSPKSEFLEEHNG